MNNVDSILVMSKFKSSGDNGINGALHECQELLAAAMKKNNVIYGSIATQIDLDLPTLDKKLYCRLFIDASYEECKKALQEHSEFLAGTNTNAYTLEDFFSLNQYY